jgi:uracil phosphoribosyltransferase
MVTNLSESNSILSTWVRELRDVSIQTDRLRFRRNLERIGEVAGYEISRTMVFREVSIQTPLGETTCMELDHQPVLATILRAGGPLHNGLLNCFDRADCAFIASYRKHHRDGSFEIESHYATCPDLTGRTLIIADPMLATGASLAMALDMLLQHGKPAAIHVVAAIAATEGIEYLKRRHEDVFLWAAAIDEELTAKSYIVPGLGDAGDLAYGPKRQS